MAEQLYAKKQENGGLIVGIGTDIEYYKSIGMELMSVEKGWDGVYYEEGKVPVKPEPTVAEQVQALESETGLTRAVRELVLADNSGASDYVKGKAQEIETLAKELRSVVVAETEPESTEKIDVQE